MELIAAAIGAVLGAAATLFLTARHERGTRLAESRLKIYMKLLSIKQTHFWISSGDMPMPGRDIPPEIKERYYGEAFEIIDELRAADDLEQAPAIIDALIGLEFEHEWQRAEALAKVIEDLSKDVTPRVARALERRDAAASALMQRNQDEWWRRRGKIEPLVPTPKARQRARQNLEDQERRDSEEE